MSSYEALTRSERALPMVLVASTAPFLFGLVMIGMTMEYQANDVAHWGLDEYLGFAITAYLPVALAALALLQLNFVTDAVRSIGVRVLLGWGLINLLVFALYLMSVWSYL